VTHKSSFGLKGLAGSLALPLWEQAVPRALPLTTVEVTAISKLALWGQDNEAALT
jgi:hypothetical protein